MEGHETIFPPDREELDKVRPKIAWSGDRIWGDFELDERFVGEAESTLSPFLCGIMNLFMRCALLVNSGKNLVEQSIDTDFIRPVEPGRPYRATSQIIRIDDNETYAAAIIRDSSGNTGATANGVFRQNKEQMIAAVPSQLSTVESETDFEGTESQGEHFPYGSI